MSKFHAEMGRPSHESGSTENCHLNGLNLWESRLRVVPSRCIQSNTLWKKILMQPAALARWYDLRHKSSTLFSFASGWSSESGILNSEPDSPQSYSSTGLSATKVNGFSLILSLLTACKAMLAALRVGFLLRGDFYLLLLLVTPMSVGEDLVIFSRFSVDDWSICIKFN